MSEHAMPRVELSFSSGRGESVEKVAGATVAILSGDPNKLWELDFKGLDSATEAKVMTALEAEAKAIEAEATAAPTHKATGIRSRATRRLSNRIITQVAQAGGCITL